MRMSRGFTMVEMLVVIAIILVLVGLITPAIQEARRSAKEAALSRMYDSISTGLRTYKNDHDSYPPSRWESFPNVHYILNNEWDGAEILCQALLGTLPDENQDDQPNLRGGQPDDGKKGFGFRSGAGVGRVYGPYLQAEQSGMFAARWDENGNGAEDSGELYKRPDGSEEPKENAYVLTNSQARETVPILYYRAHRQGRTAGFRSDGQRPPEEWIWGPCGRFTAGESGCSALSINDGDNEKVARLDALATSPDDIAGGVVAKYWARTEDNGGPPVSERQSLVRRMRSAEFLLVGPGLDGRFGPKRAGTKEAVSDDMVRTGP